MPVGSMGRRSGQAVFYMFCLFLLVVLRIKARSGSLLNPSLYSLFTFPRKYFLASFNYVLDQPPPLSK